MDFTVENLCGFLIRSRLLSPEEVRSVHQRWLEEAKDKAGDLAQFSRWLVGSKYVTEYQASLLTKGHADGFFLNQYQILDRLGRGRMAGVYKAVHPLGQVVAIKVLPPSKAKNSIMLGRFQREARMAARLKHVNVVRAFQLGEVDGLHYLVMEYLDGETLDELLQRKRKLPPADAVRMVYQALLGLHHIHEQGMIHRDLKPANLMLVMPPSKPEGDQAQHSIVKILDIGLGRALFEEGTSDNAELTGEGVLLGTPDYLAPEQARDPRSIDIRADIYSLGCVLYHCLTGQPPFPDSNLLSQMVRHASETPKPLREFSAAIPEGLQQIVNWMMAKKPEERYPTPERAAQALQIFLVAGSESPGPAEEPQMRRYLTWLETNDDNEDEGPNPTPAAIVPPVYSTPSPSPATATSTVPAAVSQPNPPRPAATEAASAKATRAVSSKKAKQPRPSKPIPVTQPMPAKPVSSPALPRASDLDVELVSEAPAAAVQGWKRWLPQNAREWILVGIGAGGVALAGLLGMIIAMLLGE